MKREHWILAAHIALALAVVGFTLFFMVRHEGDVAWAKELVKAFGGSWNVEGHYSAKTRDYHKIAFFLVAAVLVIAGRLRPSAKLLQKSVTATLAFLVFLSFHTESQKDTVDLLRGRYVQYWNVYHYYLGSKYFNELEYLYLYAYTLKADEVDKTNKMTELKTVMDLDALVEKRPEAIRAQVVGRDDFTEKRWKEFRRDIRAFHNWISPYNWSRVLRDHGYNATPTWNTFGSALSNLFSIRHKWSRVFVFSIDQIYLLITFLGVGWAFGSRKALLSALFFLSYFGNEYFTVGGFIRYDWFCCTVLAFCLYQKGYYQASAPFLAYAAMTRIFPGFLLLGPGIQWLIEGIRSRSFERKHRDLFLSFAAWCVALFLIGGVNAHGFKAWESFYTDIKLHTAKHYLGPKRVGLKHLFVDDLGTKAWVRGSRLKAFENQKTIYRVSWAVMMAAFALAVLRRRREDAYLLGYMFIFTLLVLSRYYWSLFAMMFLLAETDRSRWRNLFSEVLILLMTPIALAFRMHESSNVTNHMILTTWLGAYFLFIAASFLIDDATDWIDARRARDAAASAPPALTPAEAQSALNS